MQLSEGRVRLITANDLDRVLAWRNSERIRKNMFSDHQISPEEHQRWFAGLDAGRRICLIFELNGCSAGVVNITDIDQDNNKCSWGFYVGAGDAPPGTGLIMGYHGLQYIFEKMCIRRLCSKAFAFNISSINYHKKLGFREEGWLLKDIKKNNVYEDVVIFALFRDQWQQRRGEIEKIFADRVL